MSVSSIKTIIIISILFSFLNVYPQSGFRSEQKKFSRVRNAYNEKEKQLKSLVEDKGIEYFNADIFLRVFKQEKTIEVWIKGHDKNKFILLTDYKFCSTSGTPGPKRKQGDLQIPEGCYYIDRFNPYSNFHLSLGISYPNRSDKILGNKTNPGGDIFIHGSCVTIGCIPITDDKIKELYILAVEAKNSGQVKIPVFIFPAIMNDENMSKLRKDYSGNTDIISFWKNLKTVYDHIEKSKNLPEISVNKNGQYIIK